MWLSLCLLLAFAAAPDIQTVVQEGLAAVKAKDTATALARFEQAAAMEPESAAVWYLLAQTHLMAGNRDDALAAAEESAKFAGSDTAVQYNLAVFFLSAGEPVPSIAAAERVLAVENSADVHSLLGRAYTAQKDLPKAIEHYREAWRLSPYSDQALYDLAQSYLLAQDFTNAIAVLEEGRKTFQQVPQLEIALGVAYYGQRRFSDSVDCFLGVIRTAPEIPQPYQFVGRMLEHASGRLPEITERAVNFEKIAPESPVGYVLHARAIMQQLPPSGYPAEAAQAEDLLRKALSIKEDQPGAHYLAGTLLARKKDFEAAAKHLERSIELDAEAPQPHFRLAIVYSRLGRKEDAARERALHEKLSAEEGLQGNDQLLPPQG